MAECIPLNMGFIGKGGGEWDGVEGHMVFC